MFPNFPEVLKIPTCVIDPMSAYPLVRIQDSLSFSPGLCTVALTVAFIKAARFGGAPHFPMNLNNLGRKEEICIYK